MSHLAGVYHTRSNLNCFKTWKCCGCRLRWQATFVANHSYSSHCRCCSALPERGPQRCKSRDDRRRHGEPRERIRAQLHDARPHTSIIYIELFVIHAPRGTICFDGNNAVSACLNRGSCTHGQRHNRRRRRPTVARCWFRSFCASFVPYHFLTIIIKNKYIIIMNTPTCQLWMVG